jgi:hypothetical protein
MRHELDLPAVLTMAAAVNLRRGEVKRSVVP